jgi:hypothetical protein
MGVNVIDLTTVAAVNNLLSQTVGTDAALIQTEITNLSRYILNRTSRPNLSQVLAFNETYSGSGSDTQMLRNYPILSVQSLAINGRPVPQSPGPGQVGWVIDQSGSQATLAIIGAPGYGNWSAGESPWRGGGWGNGNAPPLGLPSYRFLEGRMNVQVQYTAGYLLQTLYMAQVPSSPPYTITVPNAAAFWADLGVTLPNGAPVTGYNVLGREAIATQAQAQLTANAFIAIQGLIEILGPSVVIQAENAGIFSPSTAGVPTAGVTPGVYTFPSLLAGQEVVISYEYGGVPEDLNEAATKVVATYYRRPKYLDQTSQMQPGVGTTSYNRSEWPAECAGIIGVYKRVFQV